MDHIFKHRKDDTTEILHEMRINSFMCEGAGEEALSDP